MSNILLAHTSKPVCDSLRSVVEANKEFYVVGTAPTAEQLYFLLPHADIVLLGTKLEDATAVQVLPEISMTHPQVKVLIMGLDDQPETIINYIEAGADGYILQNESAHEVVKKLDAASDNKALISPNIAGALFRRLSHLAQADLSTVHAQSRESHFHALTKREQEVLSYVQQGRTNREIANELYIERGTVKNHVHNILKKLEVDNRHEAATVYQAFTHPTTRRVYAN